MVLSEQLTGGYPNPQLTDEELLESAQQDTSAAARLHGAPCHMGTHSYRNWHHHGPQSQCPGRLCQFPWLTLALFLGNKSPASSNKCISKDCWAPVCREHRCCPSQKPSLILRNDLVNSLLLQNPVHMGLCAGPACTPKNCFLPLAATGKPQRSSSGHAEGPSWPTSALSSG